MALPGPAGNGSVSVTGDRFLRSLALFLGLRFAGCLLQGICIVHEH